VTIEPGATVVGNTDNLLSSLPFSRMC